MEIERLQDIKRRYKIVGNCNALNRALDVACQVAPTDLSVLIEGESGVGKEIVPRLIHDLSPRNRKKYLAINCGSIPEGTIDSELFLSHLDNLYTNIHFHLEIPHILTVSYYLLINQVESLNC